MHVNAMPVLKRLRGDLNTLPARFAAKVDASDPEGCWPWTGSKNQLGYGQIDKVGANRVSYFLATGIDPADLFVLHHCDNPPCVRPSHLFLGTQRDNVDDRMAKGRPGARLQKITEIQIEGMRLLWAEGLSSRQLAPRFGISASHALRLVRGGQQPPWRIAGMLTTKQVLTLADVERLRTEYATGRYSQYALADRYGICQPHVSRIVRGLEWKAA